MNPQNLALFCHLPLVFNYLKLPNELTKLDWSHLEKELFNVQSKVKHDLWALIQSKYWIILVPGWHSNDIRMTFMHTHHKFHNFQGKCTISYVYRLWYSHMIKIHVILTQKFETCVVNKKWYEWHCKRLTSYHLEQRFNLRTKIVIFHMSNWGWLPYNLDIWTKMYLKTLCHGMALWFFKTLFKGSMLLVLNALPINESRMKMQDAWIYKRITWISMHKYFVWSKTR